MTIQNVNYHVSGHSPPPQKLVTFRPHKMSITHVFTFFLLNFVFFFPPWTVLTRTGGGPSPGPPSAGPHKISLFFSPLPLQISLFFFPLWGFLCELWPGLEAVDHPNSASLCETPVASWYFCFVPCVFYVPFVIFFLKNCPECFFLSRLSFFILCPMHLLFLSPTAVCFFVPFPFSLFRGVVFVPGPAVCSP